MHHAQPHGQHFLSLEQVTQISPGVPAAHWAVTLGVNRERIRLILGIFQIDGTVPGKESGMPGISGGHDTVEEIHTPGHGFNDVAGGPDPHEVPGFLPGHVRLHRLDDLVHHLRALPHRQAANGIAGQIQVCNPLHMLHANVPIGPSLVDAPKHLMGVHRIRQLVQAGIFCFAPLQPPVGPVHTPVHVIPGRRIFNALIEGHTNVRAQVGLNLHTLLRPHKNPAAVNVGGKIHPFLLNFP